jgi:hypothetical protein
MYSAKKIQATLEAFAATEGWMPEAHSIQETDEFKSYINSIVKIGSNSKGAWIESIKPLASKRQKDISRWIENEQAMCSIDSGYFESRYAYIQDECATVTKFKNRKSQEVIDSVIADLEERDFGIELLVLGSRQSGTGTKVLLKLMHRALFVPNTNVFIGSIRHEESEYTKSFLDIAYNNLPWWLPPLRTPKCGFSNSSKLTLNSGISASMVQGFTPNCIYISNVDDYPQPSKTIEQGILAAVHSSRNTFMVLHGMRKCESGWLADTYRYAKEYWPQGKFRLCPLFIPWAMCSDIYPHPDWLRKYPVKKGWTPLRETIEHKSKCEIFIRSTPYLAKVAGANWCMSREQQWFWEFTYLEAKARKTLEQFEKNFAPDDEETPIESSADTDFDVLFPNPINMQERVGSIRHGLLEAR